MPYLTILKADNTQKNNNDFLVKSFSLSKDGTLQKEAPGRLYSGNAILYERDLAGLQKGIEKGLDEYSCLCLGVPKKEVPKGKRLGICTEHTKNKKGRVARTKENFEFRKDKPAFMLLDLDHITESVEEALEIIYTVVPELRKAGKLIVYSSSSGVKNKNTGELLSDSTSAHVYIEVLNGADIPRALKSLFDRLMLKGHGICMISRAPSHLKRGIVDAAVGSPERLVYEQSPKLSSDLAQQRKTSELIRGGIFDTSSIKKLIGKQKKELEKIWEGLKFDKRDEYNRVFNEKLNKLIAKGHTHDEAFEIIKGHQEGVLESGLVLYTKDLGEVTVGEMFDNPKEYDGKTMADPLEPGYNGGSKTTAIFYANIGTGRPPVINSFAHNRETAYKFAKTKELDPRKHELIIRPNDLGNTVDDFMQFMAEHVNETRWGFYQYRNDIGYIKKDEDSGEELFHPYNADNLALAISHIARTYEYKSIKDDVERVEAPVPVPILNKMIATPDSFAPKIYGILTHPTVTRDGKVIGLHPGYCDGLYFSHKNSFTVSDLTFMECYHMIGELMFTDILFDDTKTELMQASFISMMLSAVLRAQFKTGCPGYFVTANMPGSGKSTVINMAFNVVYGRDSLSNTWSAVPEERKKALASALMNGGESIVFDNITEQQQLHDGNIAQALSEGKYRDRLLGKSETMNVQSNVLFVLCGNSLELSTELSRRFIAVTLSAHEVDPESRNFADDDILNTMLKKRTEILSYLLRMLQLGATMKNVIPRRLGVGTFWDKMVRNPIMSAMGIDIEKALAKNLYMSSETNEKDVILEELKNWWHIDGGNEEAFTASDIYNAVENFIDKNTLGTHILENDSPSHIVALHTAIISVFPKAFTSPTALNRSVLPKLVGHVADCGRLDNLEKNTKKANRYKIVKVKSNESDNIAEIETLPETKKEYHSEVPF